MKRPQKKLMLQAQAKFSHILEKFEFHQAYLAEDPNFEYTITASGISIVLMDINGTIVHPVKQTGKIWADTGAPFYIEIRANLNSPTGTGEFQLKYLPNEKNVFAETQKFTFMPSGKGGLFLQDVKLPI